MAENKKHIFEEKLTKGMDIDEDILLESFRRHEHNSLKILLGLYKGQYFRLFLAVLMFAVKHTPVWVLPIAPAAFHHLSQRDAVRTPPVKNNEGR